MLSPDPVPIVRVRGLRKTYGRATAVDDLDLTVGEGEIHGFLGPNGAGKSTTLRILLGLIRPTAGTVEVLGRDPWREPTVTNAGVAYVPGDVALWPNLTGGETIDLLLQLRGGGDAGERERLIQRFALDPRKKARTYSTGNRQKVALIAAFARRAPLYVLDEPTAGLDPLMEAVFREEVLRVRDAGSTVLLSSHILSEVEQLCDRVTIIRDGSVVETGGLRDLLRHTTTRFEVTGVPAAALTALAGVSEVSEVDGLVAFDAAPESLPAVLDALHTRGATSLSAAPSTLETLFLRHYESDRS